MDEAVFSRDAPNLSLGLVQAVVASRAPGAAALRIRRLRPTRKHLMRVHMIEGSFPEPGGGEVCVIEAQEGFVRRENGIDNNIQGFYGGDFTRLRAVNLRDKQVVAIRVGEHF